MQKTSTQTGRMEEESHGRNFDHLKTRDPLELTEKELRMELEERVHNNYTNYRVQLMRNLNCFTHTLITESITDRLNGLLNQVGE